jgi:hypothetical protein
MKVALVCLLFLTACASQAVLPYVGKSYTDLQLDWGKPVNEIAMPDGRRAVQYRWGGGTVVLPTNTTATATTIGQSTFINAQTYGGGVVQSEGCLVSFIMERRGNEWVVTEARWPQRVSC